MRFSTRNILLLGFAGIVVGGLAWVSFRTEPVPVDLHEVTRGDMRLTVNADGETRIRDIYEVAAPIAGTAKRSPVEVGDMVIAGETVVAVVEPIAPSLLDERSRIQAQAAVREADAGVHLAESQLKQAVEDLSYSQSQFDRVQALVTRGVESITRLEDVTQQLAVKQAAHEAAVSNVDMAKSSLERAQAALIDPTSEEAGGGASCCVPITAPISGTVLDVGTISARPVDVGTRLLSIGQRDDLEIVADLLSSDALRLTVGAEAEVDRWGGPDPLAARLREVEPSAYTKVSALGIEEQRVDVRFDLLSPVEARPGLGDGYAVFLRIVEWQGADVVRLPVSALFRLGDGWAVFVVDGGAAHLTPVTIGHRNGITAEVLSGVEPGARVITHPSDDIADGVPVVERNTL